MDLVRGWGIGGDSRCRPSQRATPALASHPPTPSPKPMDGVQRLRLWWGSRGQSPLAGSQWYHGGGALGLPLVHPTPCAGGGYLQGQRHATDPRHSAGRAVCRHAAVDRAVSGCRAAVLAPADGAGHARLDRAAAGAGDAWGWPSRGGGLGVARRAGRIPAVHRAAAGALHRRRRHPAARRAAWDAGGQHCDAGVRDAAGWRDGHHRRLDGADPSAAACQRAPAAQGAPGGLLHRAGGQRRRRAQPARARRSISACCEDVPFFWPLRIWACRSCCSTALLLGWFLPAGLAAGAAGAADRRRRGTAAAARLDQCRAGAARSGQRRRHRACWTSAVPRWLAQPIEVDAAGRHRRCAWRSPGCRWRSRRVRCIRATTSPGIRCRRSRCCSPRSSSPSRR